MTQLSSRYAKAVFALAEKSKNLETVRNDLVYLEQALAEIPELRQALVNPVLARGEKKNAVRKLLKNRIHKLTMELLFLLIDKKREQLLDDIPGIYQRMLDKKQGIVDVHVVSPFPVEKAEAEKIRERLKKILEKRVNLEIKINSSLVAGLIIKIGDRLIDGSSRGHLERLRTELLKV